MLSLPLQYDDLVHSLDVLVTAKVQNVMSQLRTLKNRSKLRRVCKYAPKLAQDTRWGSTYTMLQRYMVIEPYFRECVFDDELKNSFLKRNEKNTVTEILEDLKKFESVSMISV